MKRFVPVLSLALLVLGSAIIPSCGGSQTHPLQSITVTPQSIDANGSSVQFVATGNYNSPPRQVTPQSAGWGICKQNAPTNEVSVTSSGLAQCASGAAGTYTVFASVDTNPKSCTVEIANGPCGTGPCIVTGTAQLTCP